MLQSPSQLLQDKLEPTSREGEVEHYLRAASSVPPITNN
jgi:hypothetical protein